MYSAASWKPGEAWTRCDRARAMTVSLARLPEASAAIADNWASGRREVLGRSAAIARAAIEVARIRLSVGVRTMLTIVRQGGVGGLRGEDRCAILVIDNLSMSPRGWQETSTGGF